MLSLLFSSVTIKYHGKESHASAYPWEGINALDAAVLCYNNLSVLRQQMKPDWRVHGEQLIALWTCFFFFSLKGFSALGLNDVSQVS